MQVTIDSGVRSIEIIRNGEHVGDIKFSLSDPALLNRLRTVSKKAQELESSARLAQIDDIEAALDEAVHLDNDIRGLLDWGFGAAVSDIVFGDSFSVTTSGGVTALEQFLSGVMPYVEEAFKAEVAAADARRKTYLEKYKK